MCPRSFLSPRIDDLTASQDIYSEQQPFIAQICCNNLPQADQPQDGGVSLSYVAASCSHPKPLRTQDAPGPESTPYELMRREIDLTMIWNDGQRGVKRKFVKIWCFYVWATFRREACVIYLGFNGPNKPGFGDRKLINKTLFFGRCSIFKPFICERASRKKELPG